MINSSTITRAASAVLCIDDLGTDPVRALCARYGIGVLLVADGANITGSFWGAPEAGVAGTTIYLRNDTPVHSFLHEFCHVLCMDGARRRALLRDAGGDDAEECAVCYLQILLADELPGVGRERLCRDMDAWGYSFRLGSAARWFADDADDARQWLETQGLLDAGGRPCGRLRP